MDFALADRVKTTTKIKIGTSGIVLPGPKATFPEDFKSGTRLHYYSSLFNTLEINSSFYKIPMPSTFAKWAGEVPDDFAFTAKLWRGITHERNLAYEPNDINQFMYAANQLGEKKGCLLVQFPASITYDYVQKVEKILQQLQQLNGQGEGGSQWQLAIELRHLSWHQEAAYALFNKCETSVVFHDMPASKTPTDHPATRLIYYRFHGPTGDYTGSYSAAFIREYAKHINRWQQNGKDIYVYFNNTIGGALENAQLLQQLI